MNRQIKFRALDKIKKQMIYLGDADTSITEGAHFAIVFEEFGHSYNERTMDEFILMQFTGLYDKNGKEIYEGDIFLHNGNKSVVEFTHGAFMLKQKRGNYIREWWNYCKYAEIIGNIHEHNNLLNVPKTNL